MLPKPICSRAEYERALREMEAYFESEPAPGSAEAERFETLMRMVEDFEAAHYVVECPGCGEIRLELQHDPELTRKDPTAITEQVLAEFCQGCLSNLQHLQHLQHPNEPSWRLTQPPMGGKP